MTQTIETTTQSRYCKVTIGNLIVVTVFQHVSPVDFKMVAPFVACPPLVREYDLDFVQTFGEALQQAAAVAREWSQDTGKDFRLMAGRIEELEAERDELQASSDLRWRADQRARERWKAAHPDKPLMWPDHTDLCVWLMGRIVELEVVANDLFPLALAHAAVYQVGHELPNLHETHSEIIERAKSAIGGFRS